MKNSKTKKYYKFNMDGTIAGIVNEKEAILLRCANDCPTDEEWYLVDPYVILPDGKVVYPMTYVGIMKSRCGLVAFGDTKLSMGATPETAMTDAGETDKVFRNNKLLVCFHGNAEDEINNYEYRNIYDIIANILKAYPDMDADDFVKTVKSSLVSDKIFNLIIGHRDRRNADYVIEKVLVSSNLTIRNYDDGGIIANRHYENLRVFPLPIDCSLAQMKEYAVFRVNQAYREELMRVKLETDNPYVDIGGHIRVMTLPGIKGAFDETYEFTG